MIIIILIYLLNELYQSNGNKEVLFKNCTPFTDCISEINNTQVDNAKDIGVVMPMYNLIEYNDNYSKTSGSLWQYYRDEPVLKFEQKIRDNGIAGNGRKNVEIMVTLKYLSNFWRTLEMPLINCEINIILTWSDKCVLSNDLKATAFAITHTKIYVPVVTLSTQDNVKLLQQLKSGFKRTIIIVDLEE